MEKLKHLLESQQFTPELLFYLFKRADELRIAPDNSLKGKILTTLFFEPSTRTRLSFESAMIRMGGDVISTENARDNSSAIKGESIEDTIRIVAAYSHCIAMRHYEDRASKRAASVSNVPIINAGDGRGQHPTQALLDVYTIFRELGRLDNLKVAMVGDLANGRTARSLCYLLGNFPNTQIAFVSPPSLKMGEDVKNYLREQGNKFYESEELKEILEISDVVYVLRTQKERMNPEDYEKAKGKFVLNTESLKLVRLESRVLHPLPHVEEIDLPIEVEQKDQRAAYFRQAENGLYARMALLEFMLK